MKLTDRILLATVGGLFILTTLWLVWVRMHWETLIPMLLQ
jgi:hypothetical protein